MCGFVGVAGYPVNFKGQVIPISMVIYSVKKICLQQHRADC